MFRENIEICLDDGVSDYEAEIDKIYGNAPEGSFDELRESAAKLALDIQIDKNLRTSGAGICTASCWLRCLSRAV